VSRLPGEGLNKVWLNWHVPSENWGDTGSQQSKHDCGFPPRHSVLGMSSLQSGAAPSRVFAVDLARFLAIVGMIYVHVGASSYLLSPDGIPGWVTFLGDITTGNSAYLFAVVSGVGMVLSVERYRRDGQKRSAYAAILARGAVIILIGVAFQLAGAVASISILIYFGVAMILAGLVHTLRPRTLLIVAGAMAVFGPVLNGSVRAAVGGGESMAGARDVIEILRCVFLTGEYPVVTWLPLMLTGMSIAKVLLRARRDGRDRRVAIWFVFGGLVLTITSLVVNSIATPFYEKVAGGDGTTLGFGGPPAHSLAAYLLASPHTGTFFDIARGVGVSIIVLGVLHLLTRRTKAPSFALRAVAAAGGTPLTIYVVHIATVIFALSVTLTAKPDDLAALTWWYFTPWAFLLQLSGVLLFGTVLAVLKRRGPLETLTSFVAATAATLVRCTSTDTQEVERSTGRAKQD
jgi:uncharacterized membrane protein